MKKMDGLFVLNVGHFFGCLAENRRDSKWGFAMGQNGSRLYATFSEVLLIYPWQYSKFFFPPSS